MISLEKYLTYQDEILAINEQIISMMQLSGVDYDAIKVQSSPSDSMGALYLRIEKLETRREKLRAAQDETLDRINSLTNKRYVKILTYRYVSGLSWSDIAERMSVSDRWVRVLVRRAESRYYAKDSQDTTRDTTTGDDTDKV